MTRLKGMERKTVVFVVFMLGFLGMLLYFTYYSRILYVKNLPTVVTVMPERSEYYENGRFLYYVSTCAVQRDTEGKDFIYTAREYEDVLGQRNIVTKILIRVIETKEDKTLIDGIVQEEPIITEDASLYMPLQPVLLEKVVDE